MSDSNAVKIDLNLGGLFDFCLPDNDRGDSLSGNEVHTYRNDDDGAAEIPDPVENFCKAVEANRFNTTPEGAPLRKRWADNDPFALAIQKAARMRKEGKVMKLYDAAGNVLAEKEVSE